MKLLYLSFFYLCIGNIACSKENIPVKTNNALSAAEKEILLARGLSSDNVIRLDKGIVVEGDIFISYQELPGVENRRAVQLPRSEHYYTGRLVSGGIIRVTVDVSLPQKISVAIDSALLRYNNLGLSISFLKVNAFPDIAIIGSSISGITGITGFPTISGPSPIIELNTALLSSWRLPSVTSVITHLIGHSIGFHHSDISNAGCGSFLSVRDSLNTIAPAVHIPGTPVGSSANSWMAACISDGINRPFTSADITALNYLY